MTETTEPTELPPPASEEKPSEAESKRGLTKEQWKEIEIAIEMDTMPSIELAAKYGVSASAISQYLRRRLEKDGYHVKRGSKKHLATAAAAPAVAAAEAEVKASFAKKRVQRIEETREQGYLLRKAVGAKAQSLVAELLKAGGRTAAVMANEIKAYRHLDKLIDDNVRGRLTLLEAHKQVDEDDLPTLVFEDLSDEEIAKIQQQDDELDAETLDDVGLDDDDIVLESGS